MAALCAEDLDDGVEVVSAGRVDWYTCGLVDYDEVVAFVDDTDWLRRNGGFMTVAGVRDDLAVLDDRVAGCGLAIHGDETLIECPSLMNMLVHRCGSLGA